MTTKSQSPTVELTESEKTYRTSDIQMASVLVAVGHKLIDVTEEQHQTSRGNSSRSVFVFLNDEVKQTIIEYVNRKVVVNARDLLDTFRNLKQLSHNKGAR